MLKKIERLLILSKKNNPYIRNISWNFSQEAKNKQKIITHWRDLFKASTLYIDFQRSIKNNTIEQLLISHLKNTGQYISLKHLLQLYARSYSRNSKTFKSFTTQLNNRLVQESKQQLLQAFDQITKGIFNTFSFSMKLNLLIRMILNYRLLKTTDKQRLLNMMLGLDYISKQILEQYREECKLKKEIVFDNTNPDIDEQFDYILNKLQNLHYLKDIMIKKEFDEIITYQQYEILLNKYFQKLETFNSFLKILKKNPPHTIFIKKLIFQNQIPVDNYKLRMAAIYGNIFNVDQNLYIFRKKSVQMYIPLIMSFFNRNDRYLLKTTMMRLVSQGIEEEKNKLLLLKLCQKYNFIFKPLLFNQAKQIRAELSLCMNNRTSMHISQGYKKVMNVLQNFNIVHNLSIKNVFLQDKDSEFLMMKLHRFQSQITNSYELILKDCIIKKIKIFSKIKRQLKLKKLLLIETKFQQQEDQEIQRNDALNESDNIRNQEESQNIKNNQGLELLMEQLNPNININPQFVQKNQSYNQKSANFNKKNKKSKILQNNGLQKSYNYNYLQEDQIEQVNNELLLQLKQMIVLIESLGIYFRYYKPVELKLIKTILNQFTYILNHFICLPKVLQNLLIIRFKNPNKQFPLFNSNLQNLITKAQNDFNNVCANLEKISSQNTNFKFDTSYENFLNEVIYNQPAKNTTFHTEYNNPQHKQSSNPDYKIKNFINERYILCEENIINNLRSSNLINFYCENSEIKMIVQNILSLNIQNIQMIKYKKNYIDYPYFTDFLIEVKPNQFSAVYIIDYSKYYVGIPQLVHQNIRLSQQYFKSLGYNIIQIDYNDYTGNKKKIIEKLKGESKQI